MLHHYYNAHNLSNRNHTVVAVYQRKLDLKLEEVNDFNTLVSR